MLKVNYELAKKVQQVIASNPKADQEQIVEKIASSNVLRMKKQSIKVGVKQYLKSKNNKIDSDKKQPITNVIEIDKPKKKVKRQKQQLEIEFQDHPSYKFQKLGGIEQTLKQIKNNIITPIESKMKLQQLGISSFKGFLIAGPVGSGKTLIANCILSHFKNNLHFNAYSVNAGILSQPDAQENLKKLFQAAKQNQPSIILIDDIDVISSKESSKRPQGPPIFALINQIDKTKADDIYIITTSSNPQKLDISLKKVHRFQKVVTVNMSSDQSRQNILLKMLEGAKHNITQQQLVDISKSTSGFMAADLLSLVREAGLHAILQKSNEPLLTYEHLKNSIKYVQPVLKKQGFTDIPKTTLDDVGGLKNLKQQLERQIIVPLRQQKKFKEMNFEVQSGGVLLYGPPGCGKTMLAKAIANAVRANFIIVKGPQLLNKYVGESQQAVRQVFGRAQRAAPCVIFFDEFDALAPRRSDQGNQVTERVVNTLLTALDGVEERKMVFVIAATNRKDMIDEATLRAGRIQKHLYVPEPNQQQRIDILKAITKSMKINKDITFNQIAKKTKGFSGADLKFLVKQATVNAIMCNRCEVTTEDLNKSLAQVLEAKNKDQLQEKVHQIELKDNEQNQQFAYHSHVQKNRVEMVAEKSESNVNKLNGIMDQFVDFLSKKIQKKHK